MKRNIIYNLEKKVELVFWACSVVASILYQPCKGEGPVNPSGVACAV